MIRFPLPNVHPDSTFHECLAGSGGTAACKPFLLTLMTPLSGFAGHTVMHGPGPPPSRAVSRSPLIRGFCIYLSRVDWESGFMGRHATGNP